MSAETPRSQRIIQIIEALDDYVDTKIAFARAYHDYPEEANPDELDRASHTLQSVLEECL